MVATPATPHLRAYCIQQHRARRLHFDLRLEVGGTLKSFALPKGPPAEPGERRLAVPTEDHPSLYLEFEGVIPPGNYGAGAMIVWDRGVYEEAEGADPAHAMAGGKLALELRGEKLRGGFELVRLGAKKGKAARPAADAGGGEGEWLIIKKRHKGAPLAKLGTAPADGEPAEAGPPGSVVTGYGLDELAAAAERVEPLVRELAAAGAPRRPVRLVEIDPAAPSTGSGPFSSPDWLFELKWDGARVIASRDGPDVKVLYRGGRDASVAFPEVVQSVRALPVERAIVDGEVCALDDEGRSSFGRLQQRFGLTDPRDVARAAAELPVVLYLFDLLALLDLDLRPLPLERRKAALRELLPAKGRRLRYCDHIVAEGEALYDLARERGLEGLVAKRRASPYRGGRTLDWLKIKNEQRQTLAIVGYTAGHGPRERLGALHLACYRGGRLAYAGKVGSGLDADAIDALLRDLEPIERRGPPDGMARAELVPPGKHVWVEPRLVCEVKFNSWTSDEMLRQPVYLGLRPDRTIEDCIDEREREREPEPEPEPERDSTSQPAVAATVPMPPPALPARRPSGRYPLSNPEKLLWPDTGVTKAELLAYYEAVAPFLLPYLRDRPLTVVRYPDGIDGKMFFQKSPPQGAPSWLRVVEAPDEEEPGKLVKRIVCDDERTLAYLANLAAIVLHMPAIRLSAADRPDWLVLDLDPKEAPFARVVEVAGTAKALLDELGAPSTVKTSGATGLHILVPVGAAIAREGVRQLAELLARLIETRRPDIATIKRVVSARGGRVYVDFGQNLHRTIVAPFSPRARPGAPVSMPLRWDEVTADLRPDAFTLRNVVDRLRREGDPLRPALEGPGIDLAKTVARIEAINQ